MGRIILRPSFQKDLAALKRNHRKNYEKTSAVLIDIETDSRVSINLRPDSRIPNAVKYELADGYRLVFQKLPDQSFLALSVGTHDHVDSFLDGHKGWVFDESGRAREIRVATIDETTVEIVTSSAVERDQSAPVPGKVNLFADFTDDMFKSLEVPSRFFDQLREIDDPNALTFMRVLEEIDISAPSAANLVLAFATGNSETQESVLSVARGQSVFAESIPLSEVGNLGKASDEFIFFDDPADLKEVLKRNTFEQWQLFLHPAQKGLVERHFHGPARIRGISGSGKTVVGMHRARYLAKKHISDGSKILFTTFNRELAKSAGRLLNALCGPERSIIDVTHLHKWCLDFIVYCTGSRPRYSPLETAKARDRAVVSLPLSDRRLISQLPIEFVWDEVEFILGRFLHEQVSEYLGTDRTGRGRALTEAQRHSILKLYQNYSLYLSRTGTLDPADFVRYAYRLRSSGQKPREWYAAVIVDEVQDISELGLRLLHSLVGDRPDGLLLVGDNAQRIYTRGYSMRNIGIDVSGRSVILTKNYRNTRQILGAGFPLVTEVWQEETKNAGVEDAKPIFSVRDGPKPAIVRCKNTADEARFISIEIKYLLNFEKYRPSEICILARNSVYRDLAHKALKTIGVPVAHYQTRLDGSDSREQDAVRVSSLHSAKGHEYAAVFIIGMAEGVFPIHGMSGADVDQERALLYVGITRARDIVYLSYSEHDEGGRRLERSRFLRELSSSCDLLVFRQ